MFHAQEIVCASLIKKIALLADFLPKISISVRNDQT